MEERAEWGLNKELEKTKGILVRCREGAKDRQFQVAEITIVLNPRESNWAGIHTCGKAGLTQVGNKARTFPESTGVHIGAASQWKPLRHTAWNLCSPACKVAGLGGKRWNWEIVM